MGISFKVSKTGRRFNPKLAPLDVASLSVEEEEPNDAVITATKKKGDTISLSTRKLAGEASENNGIAEIPDNEVSFTLNLFPNGYSITKPMETCENPEQAQGIDLDKFLLTMHF
ncbi:UNVERIFIED_CONTAM: protein PHYTOCHROME-DEPENDENT LATE-FLOWERING [Sesamum radiatum]|uniref:Protein PHYTOCHROME-DEPENDENT LATE-FLOWERING n=1 Tax=Sesamum radiatum TaxID=300843 RepID=A0AAW2PEY8_SESRA